MYILFFIFFIFNQAMARSGVYTGSFDPPTKAHIEIILKSLQECNIQQIAVLVNTDTEHKKYHASVANRVQMLKEAFANNDQKNRIHIIAQSYPTKDEEFEAIKTRFNNDELVLITGTDSYEKYQKKRPYLKFLFNHIAVVTRTQEIIHLSISNESQGVSSSKARDQLKNQQPVEDLLSPTVIAYIQKNCLYK